MSETPKLKLQNFRCIVPLRSTASEQGTSQDKLLFRSANLDAVDQPTVDYLRNQLGVRTIIDFRNLCPSSDALSGTYKPVTLSQFRQAKAADKSNTNGYHVFNPFMNAGYVWELTKRQPYSMYPQVASWSFRYFVLGDENAMQEFGLHAARVDGLVQSYHDFLVAGKEVIRSTLEIIADRENLPALICCLHGKDRTGIFAALLLHILGFSIDSIVDDYNASEATFAPYRAILVKNLREQYGIDESFIDAKKETMIDLLKWIDEKFGSVDSYLLQAGVDQTLRNRLCETLKTKN